MSKYKHILMDAPKNSGGVSVEGETYVPDDNDQISIPSHLAGLAAEHGFKIADKQPKEPAAAPEAPKAETTPPVKQLTEEEQLDADIAAEDAAKLAKTNGKNK